MRVDLHIHTRESSSAPEHWFGELIGAQECYTQAESALAEALRKGFDAVAIANHNSADDALRLARARPARVIPACEYTVYAGRGRYAHVVTLGIDSGSHARLMRERSRGLARFAGLCRGEGLAHFLAHPAWEVGREKRGLEPADLREWLRHFDVIESLNGNCHLENEIASGLARCLRKGRVGGSDAHDLDQIGTVWTEAEAGTTEEFLERVRAGETAPCGRPATHGEFASAVRAITGTFYRRELLRTMRAGSLGGYIARARIDELLKTAGEFAVLPAYLLAPQAASAAYLQNLRARAERLRGRLVDALELDLAKSIASEDLGAEERSRRLVAGLRELEAAFGGA
ncbi:MAG: PHP domain-containing protein [Planctomycetota bacterium]|jgi:predicted metal-dependent phosphoesterase TrpH